MQNNPNWIEDNLYKKIIKNIPICTADVIFLNNNLSKTLLFKRKNKPMKNNYYSVGGRLHKDEDFKKAAKRLVKQELNIVLDVDDLLFGGVISETFNDSVFKEISTHNINIFFGYILSNKINIEFDNQHDGSKWFNVNDDNINIYVRKKIKKIISKYD